MQVANGDLYGLTKYGGLNNLGVIFRIKTDGSGFTKLLDFDGIAKGSYPWGSLILGTDGSLYGTTLAGGLHNDGTVFKINQDGSGFVKLTDFDGAAKGLNPAGNLLQANDGMLYGMARGGGANSNSA